MFGSTTKKSCKIFFVEDVVSCVLGDFFFDFTVVSIVKAY